MVSKQRAGWIAGGVVVVLAIVAGVVLVFPAGTDDGTPDRSSPVARPGIEEGDGAAAAADAFAAAWQGGTLATAPVTADSGDVAGLTTLITAGITAAEDDRPVVAVTRLDRVSGDAARATAVAEVTWQLDGDQAWTYETEVALVDEAGTWKVAWTPSAIAPDLADGEVLRVDRVQGARGAITDAAGIPLVATKGAVTVGIRKSRTDDPEGTARTVAALVAVAPEALVAEVAAAGPDDFVEVATLERAAYDAIRAEIQPLPGTVFREEPAETGLPPNYARALLGTTGSASQELADGSEGRIVAGDVTGLSGLQSSQDAVLGGTPGLVVKAVPAAAGAEARVLEEFPGTPGRNVAVTLDQRVQVAADEVMATAPKPAALVAIRVSTGDVLAVSNGPSDASAYNRAMIGHYAPGSTFKIASGLTLLGNGLTPETPVDCPATITVGKVFKNAEGEVLGTVPFSKDFSESCNTAFVGQSREITAEELTQVAGLLGYRELELGVPVFGGSVPTTGDETEHAANMIGQGKVDASPFAVALASASVANGRSLNPRLIIDPAAPEPTFGEDLPVDAVAQLRGLMRLVVTEGTGSALAGVPGGEVHGKTGTAEYGNESPPRTHAWFTGYQGDIAFAVLVEDGGFGGQVAAPLAADFLTKLAEG